jgi:hypothetical protein
MEKTMDTDYGLPIPMYRPFIMVDPRFDSPLPFRCCLNQVTELTAENSTPYQLSKEQRLSKLEKLPFEVREQVYHYTINQSQACFWSEWHVVDVKRPLGHTLHCGGRIVFCNRLSVFSLYNRQCKPSLRANFRIQTTMFSIAPAKKYVDCDGNVAKTQASAAQANHLPLTSPSRPEMHKR